MSIYHELGQLGPSIEKQVKASADYTLIDDYISDLSKCRIMVPPSEENSPETEVVNNDQMLEKMLKLVMHLRLKTAKMTQEAIITHQPELMQKLKMFKDAKDSSDLQTFFKKDEDGQVLTFEEINKSRNNHNYEE